MFSKQLLKGALVGVLILTGTGCGLSTGENPPPAQTPSFSGNGYSCVGQIPTKIDLYFNDRLSEDQISEFMRCLQKSFVSFAQLTRGSAQDQYSPNEIRNFLQEHFFKDRKITDELLHEFMMIKQAMIGGSATSITRQELAGTVDLFEDIRREAIRLKPHLQVLNPRLADQQKPRDLGERLAEANNALRMTIQTFVIRLQRSKQTYSYASLTKFLTEFRTFVGWEKYYTAEDSRPVDRWVMMLKEFKEFTVSEVEPNGVRTTEWTPFLENMSRWYLAYLQYRVGVKGQPILEGVGLQNTIYLADELFRLMEEAVVSHRPSRTIPYAKISDLYQAAYGLGWVKLKIRPEGMQRALEAAFTRIFGDPRSASQNRRVLGLKVQTLNAMKVDFNRWADIQIKLDGSFRRKVDPNTVPNIQILVPGSPNVLERLTDAGDSDYDEFLAVKNRNIMRPLYTENWKVGDPFTISVVPATKADFRQAGLSNEFYNLSRVNLLRSIVTLVFRGYASKGNRVADWNSVLGKSELENFYQEFREIGIDLGVIDPRNERVGERAFTEGNLFTYASDHYNQTDIPSGKLSFTEAVELSAFMFSGFEISQRLYKDLREKCVPQQGVASAHWPRDIVNLPKLPRCCVYRELPGELIKVITNMPGRQSFLQSSTPEERMIYVENVLNAVYSKSNSEPEFVESSELTTLAVILHYGEAVMTRFDYNHDGLLTTNEIIDPENGVLPVFSGHLMSAINEMRTREVERINLEKNLSGKSAMKPKLISEADASTAFLYMLENKQAPNPEQWGDWISLGRIRWFNPDLALSRHDLALIFKVFGELLSSGASKQKASNVPQPANACFKK